MATGTGTWYGSSLNVGSVAKRYVHVTGTSFNESTGVTTVTYDVGTRVTSGNFGGTTMKAFGGWTNSFAVNGTGYYGTHNGCKVTCKYNGSVHFREGMGYTRSSGSYVSSTVDFYWYPTLPTYTVSYNANGGSGAPSSQTKTWGTNLKLSSTKPTRSGYTFLGWATSSTATSAAYSASGTYSANAKATLYAVWRKTITVSYNANGGTGAPASQSANVYNSTASYKFTLQSGKPTRTGYTFLGWATSSSATSAAYQPSGTATFSSSTALYAVWQAVTCTVSFDGNGTDERPASNVPASQTKTYDQALTLSSTVPVRTGYAFAGWADSATATAAKWQAGGSYSEAITADTTLYAVWELSYISPTITAMDTFRCDADGNDQDDGTYCKVTCSWTVDTAYDASNAVSAVAGTITPQAGGTAIAYTATVDGTTSGTASAVVAGTDADTAYTVTVTVTDTSTLENFEHSTSASMPLAKAGYVLDFRAGGEAMGIGTAAPESGLEVGYEAVFDMVVKALGDLGVTGKLTAEGGASVTGGAKVAGGVETDTLRATDATDGRQMISAVNSSWTEDNQTETFVHASNEATGNAVSFGIGEGGANRGIWDDVNDRWLINVDGSGNTGIGGENFGVNSKGSITQAASFQTRLGTDAPSSNTYYGGHFTKDSDGDICFYGETARLSNGNVQRGFVVRRYSSDGATSYTNGFYAGVDGSGSPYVNMTSGAPKAWRDALSPYAYLVSGVAITNGGSVTVPNLGDYRILIGMCASSSSTSTWGDPCILYKWQAGATGWRLVGGLDNGTSYVYVGYGSISGNKLTVSHLSQHTLTSSGAGGVQAYLHGVYGIF